MGLENTLRDGEGKGKGWGREGKGGMEGDNVTQNTHKVGTMPNTGIVVQIQGPLPVVVQMKILLLPPS